MGKIFDDAKGWSEDRTIGAWIFDPTQPDGKPRHPINSPEEYAELKVVLNKHFPIGGGKIKRVRLLEPVETEPPIPPDETIPLSEVVELLRKDIKDAGGQDAYAAKRGLSRSLVAKTLRGERRLGASMLKALSLKASQIVYPENIET